MRGLNIDMKWAFPFKSKIDVRDNRPLMYDGRLVVPTQTKEHDFVFKNTPIMQGRTELAEMLPSSQMKVIEDVSATALPRSTDLDGAVKGAEVCAARPGRNGEGSGCGDDGLHHDRSHCDHLFEMNMLMRDMFDALLKKRGSSNFP